MSCSEEFNTPFKLLLSCRGRTLERPSQWRARAHNSSGACKFKMSGDQNLSLVSRFNMVQPDNPLLFPFVYPRLSIVLNLNVSDFAYRSQLRVFYGIFMYSSSISHAFIVWKFFPVPRIPREDSQNPQRLRSPSCEALVQWLCWRAWKGCTKVDDSLQKSWPVWCCNSCPFSPNASNVR